jgi:hypothetical protein
MSPVTGRTVAAREGTLAARHANPDFKQYINLYNILTQKVSAPSSCIS